MPDHKIFSMAFSKLYSLYVQKAEKKNRTEAEVVHIICWLTGYSCEGLAKQMRGSNDLATFFAEAPQINANASLVTGVVCGVRIEDIEDPLMRNIRRLDKLIDEAAKGRAIDRILRR